MPNRKINLYLQFLTKYLTLIGVGTNKLIKNGASLTTSVEDILQKLNLSNYESSYLNMLQNNEFKNLEPINKSSQNSNMKSINKMSALQFNSEQEKIIYQCILDSPIIFPNEISIKTKYPINEVLTTLFILEINNYIKKSKGGYICI